MTTRINLISGPRNISTALMYSFRSRVDTTVVDEPLYGHYLRVTGLDYPGREHILAASQTDGAVAIRDSILGACPTPILFVKNMAHHIVGMGLDIAFLDDVINVFLIRHPHDMLTSIIRNLPSPTVLQTGLPQQCELLERIADPIVLDSADVLRNPARSLQRLCERIGIPWDEAMLSWPRGPKPEDNVQAPYWYARVHQTVGFEPYKPKNETVPAALDGVLAECRAHFDRLAAHAIRS